ncbi:hypothetical protein NXH76_09240 [Blautia schinkii]|nr:hypothetical protein [Blautia schinkii]
MGWEFDDEEEIEEIQEIEEIPMNVEALEQQEQEGSREIIGEPKEEAEHWHLQQEEMSCAVVSQEFVAESLLNKEFSEEKMVEFAERQGWYENGTSPEDAGKLLEAMGLLVEREYDAELEDIEQVLENGGKPLVSVHNAVLENPLLASFPWLSANHMIEVTGIDKTDPEHVKVIVNDSGVLDGAGKVHEWNDFQKAWETGGNYMVSAYRPIEGGTAI